MRRALLAAAVVLALVTSACGRSVDEEATAPTTPVGAVARFDRPGAHAIGTGTVDLGPTLGAVTLWYPAVGRSGSTRAGGRPDPAVGSAPLLVFAHGSGLEPTDYAALLGHVASWGVVAAAPERGRGLDLVAVAAALRRGDGDEVDLARILATDGPLVVGGHSRGTAEASRAALESEVTGAILLAGGGVTAAVAANPSPLLFVGGGNDGITDTWMRPNAAGASGPHQLVVVEDAGHLSFTRLCEDPGAVVLLTGDCAVSEVAEASARPVVAHSLVAFVRWRSGVDETPESLRADVLASFDTPVTVEGGFDGGS